MFGDAPSVAVEKVLVFLGEFDHFQALQRSDLQNVDSTCPLLESQVAAATSGDVIY